MLYILLNEAEEEKVVSPVSKKTKYRLRQNESSPLAKKLKSFTLSPGSGGYVILDSSTLEGRKHTIDGDLQKK